ncbi:MAG: sterol desaturase family protein [Luteolibacter sp.]
MSPVLRDLYGLNTGGAFGVFLLLNTGIVAGSALLCVVIARTFRRHRLFDRWEPFKPIEMAAVVVTVVLNALVSVAGWALWKHDVIHLVSRPWWGVIRDTVLMVAVMDLGMYVLHRVAHLRWIYRLFHFFHHRHEVTNPLSLFVLHPLEVIGFGSMMIGFLCVHAMDPVALTAYLGLNVLFGTLGHCGVEPFPDCLRKIPLLRLVGTSTFHAEHHERPGYNFGFYTLVWDQLFGTLDPDYWSRYQKAAEERTI